MKLLYYYVRDQDNKPVITICLGKSKRGVARGVSVCSLQDSPCKKEGKRLARNKVLKALGTQSSGDICMRDEAHKVIEGMDASENFMTVPTFFKSEFEPSLSTFEEKLLRNI